MEKSKSTPKPSFFYGARPKMVYFTGFVSGVAFASFLAFLFVALVSMGLKSGQVDLKEIAGGQAVAGAEQDRVDPKDIEVRPVDPELDHIKGDPNAKISLIEFSDLECPFCKRFHNTAQQVVDTYQGQVNWVYRHFPLDNLHSKARSEAEATECVAEQGKFWEYTDRLFEITPSNNQLPESALTEIAKEIGLDLDQFADCVSERKYKDRIDRDVVEAVKAGGRGTPYSLLIDDKGNVVPINGALPFESLKAHIEKLLN